MSATQDTDIAGALAHGYRSAIEQIEADRNEAAEHLENARQQLRAANVILDRLRETEALHRSRFACLSIDDAQTELAGRGK